MSKRKSKHPYFRDRDDEEWGIVSTLISPARKVGEEPCPLSPHSGGEKNKTGMRMQKKEKY
jgi:hypothetical protein